jgi:DNA topoisomerase IB
LTPKEKENEKQSFHHYKKAKVSPKQFLLPSPNENENENEKMERMKSENERNINKEKNEKSGIYIAHPTKKTPSNPARDRKYFSLIKTTA